MAQTSPPAMTAPPTAPSRSSPSTFSTRSDAWLSWVEVSYSPEIVIAQGNVYDNAVDCYTNAVAGAASAAAALVSQGAAASSANSAASSANATIWVSGTTYAIGDCRWSPSNRYVYRRITSGAGTTDPSADATNWALASVSAPQIIAVSGTTQTASANGHYILNNASATAVTLPASPSVGDQVWVTPGNGRTDNTILRNALKIMSTADDMTINDQFATVRLRYIDATIGWRVST